MERFDHTGRTLPGVVYEPLGDYIMIEVMMGIQTALMIVAIAYAHATLKRGK